MTITNSNLFSESYTQIKDFLNTLNIDPRNRFKPNWIHSSMPNINDKGFDGFPFIILKSEVNETDKSFDRNTSEKVFRILISAYSPEPTEVDTIADSITANFKDETKLTEFDCRELSSGPIDWILSQNGKKILFRNIGIILRSRI